MVVVGDYYLKFKKDIKKYILFISLFALAFIGVLVTLLILVNFKNVTLINVIGCISLSILISVIAYLVIFKLIPCIQNVKFLNSLTKINISQYEGKLTKLDKTETLLKNCIFHVFKTDKYNLYLPEYVKCENIKNDHIYKVLYADKFILKIEENYENE